jgi:hypothetical protein
MKYAIEMGSGAMIHIPSFIKTGSGYVPVCVSPLSLIGNASLNTFRGNEYTSNHRRNVRCVVFYAVRVVSMECLWVFLCILPLRGNVVVNTFPLHRRMVEGVVFYATV